LCTELLRPSSPLPPTRLSSSILQEIPHERKGSSYFVFLTECLL
jgi:hypothetical protein